MLGGQHGQHTVQCGFRVASQHFAVRRHNPEDRRQNRTSQTAYSLESQLSSKHTAAPGHDT